MRVTSKGQVTIPAEIREKAGLLPDSEVEFVYERGRVFIRKQSGGHKSGDQLIARLRGKGTVQMSTEEIMALTRGEE